MSQKAFSATLSFKQTQGCVDPLVHPLFSHAAMLKPSTMHGYNPEHLTPRIASDLISSSSRETEFALPIPDGWDTPRLSFVLTVNEPMRVQNCYLRHTVIGYTEAADLGPDMMFKPDMKMYLDRVIVTYCDQTGPIHTVEDYNIYTGKGPHHMVATTGSMLERLAGADMILDGPHRTVHEHVQNLIGLASPSGVSLHDASEQSTYRYIDTLHKAYAMELALPDPFSVEYSTMVDLARRCGRNYARDNTFISQLLDATDLHFNGFITYSELADVVTLTKVGMSNPEPKTPPEPLAEDRTAHAIAATVVNTMNGWMGWFGIKELTLLGHLTIEDPTTWPTTDQIKYFGSGRLAEDDGESLSEKDPTIEEKISQELKGLAEMFDVENIKLDAKVDLFGDALVRIAVDEGPWQYYHRPMYASALTSPLVVKVEPNLPAAEVLIREVVKAIEYNLTVTHTNI